MSYQSGYLVGARSGAGLGAYPRELADVPTVALPSGLDLSIPGVELTPSTPNVFLVPRPQIANLNTRDGFGFSFTPRTLALLGGGLAVLLLSSRRRR